MKLPGTALVTNKTLAVVCTVLPPRTVAVNAKCFPSGARAAAGGPLLVESPVGGGIFAPM